MEKLRANFKNLIRTVVTTSRHMSNAEVFNMQVSTRFRDVCVGGSQL